MMFETFVAIIWVPEYFKIVLNYFENPGTFLGGEALLSPADFSSCWRGEAVSSGR